MKKIISILLTGLSLVFCVSVFAQEPKGLANSLSKEKLEEISRKCLGGLGHWSMVKCVEIESNRELASSVSTATKEKFESFNDVVQPNTPVEASQESIERGEIIYSQYCFVCHGEKGKGDGPAAEFSKKNIPSLTSQNIQNITDKALFYRITAGSSLMPVFGGFMTKEDVWNIVNYIRVLSKDSKSSPSS